MKIAALTLVLCAVSMKAQQKCACVYPYEPDPPCVQQCSSMVIMSAHSEEQLRNLLGFSPQDASKLWENRRSLRKAACDNQSPSRPDISKVSANLEVGITRLIGESHYDAFVSRFRTLAFKRMPDSNVFVSAEGKMNASAGGKLTLATADQLCQPSDY
jgi:hypothetical protein